MEKGEAAPASYKKQDQPIRGSDGWLRQANLYVAKGYRLGIKHEYIGAWNSYRIQLYREIDGKGFGVHITVGDQGNVHSISGFDDPNHDGFIPNVMNTGSGSTLVMPADMAAFVGSDDGELDPYIISNLFFQVMHNVISTHFESIELKETDEREAHKPEYQHHSWLVGALRRLSLKVGSTLRNA
ncbi:MAG: hypothetical protein M1504_02635 [Candidatus Marsarchaeota archaeon]|nr:hypothetical protein [Candidatus Marsarchaeota archaeon]